MAFTPKSDWADSPATTSPITKAELDRIESGIQAAHALAEAREVVLVHNGTSYPSRPSGIPAGFVCYKGPTEPTTWLTGDTWLVV